MSVPTAGQVGFFFFFWVGTLTSPSVYLLLLQCKPGVAHTTYDGCNVLNNLKTVHSDQGMFCAVRAVTLAAGLVNFPRQPPQTVRSAAGVMLVHH